MALAPSQELALTTRNGEVLTFDFAEPTLSIKRKDQKGDLQIPVRQVIGVYTSETSVEVYYLFKKRKKDTLSLVKIEGQAELASTAKEWSEALMDVAYQGVKRCRRLRVLVNPFGGLGKARSIFNKKVEPIFRAAKCSLDVTYTTHGKHATEIVKEISLDYDAIVTLSGDGLIHEVLNGLAQHAQSKEAFNIPIAPVPTGTGNGTSLNLLGVEDGFDVSAAALNAIKGHPMNVDIFSFTQGDTKHISFMTQALGLMSELDLGTEGWRWMGDTRYFLGFLRGLVAFKSCPVTIQMKIVEQDKAAMLEAWRLKRSGNVASTSIDGPTSIPPLTQPVDEKDGWITFDKPSLYIYAGKGPYVGRDLMQFPMSLPDDGVVDIVIQEHTSRGEMLKAIDGAPTGQPFWLDSQHYFKASAYRIKPHKPTGYIAIDGEAFPFEEFQVEVLKGMGTFMSPYGYYAADFQDKKPQTGAGAVKNV